MSVVLTFILRFGRNLNHLMAQSLAIRYENDELIGELKAQRLAAEEARASAETANRGKTQFLASASHDLRQPLHALGLFGAALSAKVRDPEARDIVRNVNACVEALERLFSALMDISKLDAGAVEPVRTDFPLASLFARLEQQFALLAQSRGLRLRFVVTRVWAHTDPMLLERILSNLVVNALCHTERGGAVIGVRRRGGSLWIDVIDSGVGIAREDQDRVFDEFYRGTTARGPRSQGMGLGLAIVRRLALLLEHELELCSTARRGSRFSVKFPPAASRAPPADTPLLDHQRGPSSLRGALVAIIDDEPAVLEGMLACFTEWGADAVGARSGDAVLAALGERARYPNLIVADYRLAEGELGTGVVERLREEFGIFIPAILVSGDASAAAIADMRASTLDLLLKPVTAEELRVRAEANVCASPDDTAGGAKKKRPIEGRRRTD